MHYRAAALSVAMHMALLLPALPPTLAQPEESREHMPADRPVMFIEAHELGTGACDYSYIGLGILHGGGGELWEIAPGSPAERAGLLAGDFLMNAGELAINSLPIGTPVLLRYRRGEVTREIEVRVGRVCYGG